MDAEIADRKIGLKLIGIILNIDWARLTSVFDLLEKGKVSQWAVGMLYFTCFFHHPQVDQVS